MANTTQDDLLESFTEASGGLTGDLNGLAAAVTGATPKSSVSQKTNAQATGTAQTSNSGGAGSEVLSIATTVLESGLGIVPLVAGLIGLFTGGEDSSTPPPLVKYAMPEKMQFEGATTSDGISGADYDQMGMPRSYGSGSGGPAPDAVVGTAGGGSGSTSTAPQIQVNVQAMDARSFMDHSNEIAQAVRAAMLNLSSLNDVVSDL